VIKYLLIISLLLIHFNSFSRDLPDFDKFYSILIKLESGGKTNAVGDGGRAIGAAQIHKGYFLDAIEYNKNLQKYSYSNCFDGAVSKLIVKSYLIRYSKGNSFQEWAKLHNGGPNWADATGQKKTNLNNYWKKFKKILAAAP